MESVPPFHVLKEVCAQKPKTEWKEAWPPGRQTAGLLARVSNATERACCVSREKSVVRLSWGQKSFNLKRTADIAEAS